MKLASSMFNAEIRRDRKRLKKVLSTKLSIEDHRAFCVLTNLAHHEIKEDSQSEMLRLLITLTLSELRKHQEFSFL
jgi:hypothetical protein